MIVKWWYLKFSACGLLGVERWLMRTVKAGKQGIPSGSLIISHHSSQAPSLLHWVTLNPISLGLRNGPQLLITQPSFGWFRWWQRWYVATQIKCFNLWTSLTIFSLFLFSSLILVKWWYLYSQILLTFKVKTLSQFTHTKQFSYWSGESLQMLSCIHYLNLFPLPLCSASTPPPFPRVRRIL